MPFKDVLKEKVPESLQFTPEFKVLLEVVKKHSIKSPDELKRFVNEKIAAYGKGLGQGKQNLDGTKHRMLSRCSRDIKYYENIKKNIIKYL